MVRRDLPEVVWIRRLDEGEDDGPDATAHGSTNPWSRAAEGPDKGSEANTGRYGGGKHGSGEHGGAPDQAGRERGWRRALRRDPSGRDSSREPRRDGGRGGSGRWAARPEVEPTGSRVRSPTRHLTGSGPDEVYLARRAVDGLEVAIRVYGRPLRTERDQVWFEQELHTLGRLAQVPHVVRIHDGGVLPDGRAYVVTEFCAGGSIEDYVVMVGRLTPAEVCRVGAKLAGALMAAHQLDVFHRNLKPANVLINDAGEPMLSDFALLSVSGSDPASLAPPMPRPFVAPEAYLPELMSAAADIYSLGATLYALLSGSPPTADPLSANPPGANPPGGNSPSADPRGADAIGGSLVGADPSSRYEEVTDSSPGGAEQVEDVGPPRLDLSGLPAGRTAGPEAAGPEAAGSEAAGSEAAGPEAAGSELAGRAAAEPERAGAEPALSGSAGTASARAGSGGLRDGVRPVSRAYRVAEGRALFVDGERLAELPYVPWALMAVLRQAMAHDPQDRFATAEDFQSALLTAV